MDKINSNTFYIGLKCTSVKPKEEVAQESLIKLLVHVGCIGHSPKN